MKRDILFYHPESGSYLAGNGSDASDELINVTGDTHHTHMAILQGEWIGSNPLPRDLCKKGTEHGHQAALFCWAAAVARSITHLSSVGTMFAIPNGGARGGDKNSAQRTGAMLIAEGVRKGVPDVFLPVPTRQYAGLFIEMKKAAKGVLSEHQNKRIDELRRYHYAVDVCWSWEEARDTILSYLDGQLNATN